MSSDVIATGKRIKWATFYLLDGWKLSPMPAKRVLAKGDDLSVNK